MRPDFSIFTVNHERTPAQLRVDGTVLIPLGLFVAVLSAGMLALGAEVPPGWLPSSIRVEPRPTPHEVPIGMVVFMSTLLLFGVVAIAEGTWRILLGRMNATLLRIMLTIVALIFVAGSIASAALDRRYGQVGQ